MSLSVMISVVSVLMVIGVISLTDALLKVFIKKKSSPEAVIVYIKSPDEPIEYTTKKIMKKHPTSKIIIDNNTLSDEDLKIIDIIKKHHPYIRVQ